MVDIGAVFDEAISSILRYVPDSWKPYVLLGFFIFAVVIYCIFIWQFHRFISRRDLLELNLDQYNQIEHEGLNKAFATLLFVLEYMVILPIVVFFWFFVIAIMILVLAKEQAVGNILLISACVVGAIRITAYYDEDLSREFAKVFPFTLLIIALTTPEFFELNQIIGKLSSISGLFTNVINYLFVIMFIEFFLRVLYLVIPAKEEKDSKNKN